MSGQPSFNIPPGENSKLEPIAICGMSCNLPGGIRSPSSLWDLLMAKKAVNSQKVPKNRFNIDAHLHPNADRPGSFNVPGGYFLEDAPESFDPTFFNMTPVEAMWLDPQQRRTLEACYEALESAGVPLEKAYGTNIGVWVGSFTADYQQMNFKDPDFRHSYSATGVDTGIISNRINNIFGFTGPSSTINTACSSSIYSLHTACNSLRAGDCDAALVCGVNMILTVDQHMNTAKLGVLSPTNFSHTFDAKADGYGRGEGAGALYIKRLSDAIRDGDTIRAVIRSSAVNTNGKVPGYGITFPNALGQEKVIRAAYKRAQMDPNKTAYFECHGTGTPVGDPVEVRAASRAMNDTRDPRKNLLIGAVKPNIGHSEAASGIFAVIKAVLMVEKGIIPGVAGLETVNPEIPEAELGITINRDAIAWPEGFESRRASVSSFGYGGTNGHVIVENIEALVPHYRHGAPKALRMHDTSPLQPQIITLSAHDNATLSLNIRQHLAEIKKYNLVDVAYTLNTRRSKLAQRAFAVVSESDIDTLQEKDFTIGVNPKAVNKVAFIFTGQGAQWATIGTEAIRTFPVFRDTIRRLDAVLRTVENPPDFSLAEQLTAPAGTSRINNPDVAQPTLAAVQIAIVDLLASWGVEPIAVIGHSAGEHAAAYAAGLCSAPEAIISSYYRGYCIARYAPSGGSMLAVGKGASELADELSRVAPRLVLACENSPDSVTISGPAEAIRDAEDFFKQENVFARELRTGMAYHSSQMAPVAEKMVSLIDKAVQKIDSIDRQWRCARRVMISTVTNNRLTESELGGAYWAANLTSKVLFNTGLAALLKHEDVGDVQGLGLVEVGPHSALASPIRSVSEGNGYGALPYIPTVVRTEKNSARSLFRFSGLLYTHQYPVNLVAVNRVDHFANQEVTVQALKRAVLSQPLPLTDLPPYRWNYEKTFWAEPRLSSEYRQLTHARHDLLGRRILGLSDNSIAWRNILRIKDVPWLVDHKLGGSIMFPAAGHMAVAIEACRQRLELSGKPVTGFTLRNVELTSALIIPEGDDGIEIQVRLTAQSGAEGSACDFTVESFTDGVWTVHSSGIVASMAKDALCPKPESLSPIVPKDLSLRQNGQWWNDAFRRVGFEYGPSFAGLDHVRAHRDHAPQAMGNIPLNTTSGLMEGESRYILHPSAVDALLQLVIIAIHRGLFQEMPWGVIPVKFDEVDFYLPDGIDELALGHAQAWLPSRGPRDRKFISDATLASAAGDMVLHIKGLHTTAYDAALPPQHEDNLAPMPYFGNKWSPDVTMSPLGRVLSQEIYANPTADEAVVALVQMIDHKTPITSALIADSNSTPLTQKLLAQLEYASSVKVAAWEQASKSEDAAGDRKEKTVKMSSSPAGISKSQMGEQDIVIFSGKDSERLLNEDWLSAIKDLLTPHGSIIFSTRSADVSTARQRVQKAGLVSQETTGANEVLMLCSLPSEYTNGHDSLANITLTYSPMHSAKPEALASQLRENGVEVALKALEELDTDADEKVIVYNPFANILTQPSESSLEALKKCVASAKTLVWLTRGVNEGQCPPAGAATGFMRVLAAEQKATKVITFDADMMESGNDVAEALATVLDPRKGDATGAGEREYWLHNRVCHVNRVVPNDALNELFMGTRSSLDGDVTLPLGKLLEARLSAGAITFEASDAYDIAPLGAEEVEIQVDQTEVRSQDLSHLSDELRLVSGIVVQVGSAVSQKQVGKPVITWSSKPYNTMLRASESTCIALDAPSSPDHLQAVVGFCRALSALPLFDGLSGKSVLLLDTSPLMNKSVLAAGKAYGFNVTIAADSNTAENGSSQIDANDVAALHKYVQEAGQTLVLIAGSYSATAQSLWLRFSTGALFVLANSKGKVPRSLDILPLSRGARFHISSESTLRLTSEPEKLFKILSESVSLAKTHVSTGSPVLSLQTWGQEKVQQDGAVLAYNYGVDKTTISRAPVRLSFSPDDVYLLVGCLGGLGRCLVLWMMEHGARRFAFISRSGADKPDAAQLIEDVKQAGADTMVYRGDAGAISDVRAAVGDIVKGGSRIKGVVHAAMVLKDTMVRNMGVEELVDVLGPKMDGAQVLSQVLDETKQDDHLDFFVMTSSISGTVGQPGQSNYSAANQFLEQLSWQRNLRGLVASSLVLPMVLGVGVVADRPELEGKITRRGMYGVDEVEMLRGFAAAMSVPRPGKGAAPLNSAVIMGLEPRRLSDVAGGAGSRYPEWMDDARFSTLRRLLDITKGHGATSSGGAVRFAEQVVTIAADEGYATALEKTAEYVMQKCAAILLLPVETLEVDGLSIGQYGLDSMIGMEMRNWLFKDLGLNIAFQELLAGTMTFKALAVLVLAGLGIEAA
ncbi:lovastatin nonaketide synthase [Xylaria intraflava]|nr:lovastatin nonaketide synthase [Xylaria intraflava]